MLYFIFAGIVLAAVVFVSLPFLRGTSSSNYFETTDKLENRQREEEQNIKDKIESAKLALRDLDMENKIGKIADDDYEVLKGELLDEWKTANSEMELIRKPEKKNR